MRHRNLLAVLSFVLLFAFAACSGDKKATVTATAVPAATQVNNVPQQAAAAFKALDPSKPETLDAVEDLVKLGRAAVPAVAPQLTSPNLVNRWAAISYFSRVATADDITILANAINDSDFGNRATVAATLLRLGDKRGLQILVDATKSDEQLSFSHPPILLADYARQVLKTLSPETPVSMDNSARGRAAGMLLYPLSAPANDVAIEMQNCTANVTLNLQFSGAGATEALAATWANAIKAMWNGLQSNKCCSLHVTVNTKVGGAEDPDYAQIDVLHVPPGGRHRSDMSLGSSAESGNLSGTWDDTDTTGVVASHEAGHAMGQDDDYTDNAAGVSVPNPEAKGELDAGAPDIMAQTWPDSLGNRPTGKTRHATTIMQKYGAECPEDCMLSWTPVPRPTLIPSPTPRPTDTPTPSPTPVPTATATASPTPSPSPSPTATPTPSVPTAKTTGGKTITSTGATTVPNGGFLTRNFHATRADGSPAKGTIQMQIGKTVTPNTSRIKGTLDANGDVSLQMRVNVDTPGYYDLWIAFFDPDISDEELYFMFQLTVILGAGGGGGGGSIP